MSTNPEDSHESELLDDTNPFANIVRLQASVEPLAETVRQGDLDHGIYLNLVRAAFAKAFDYCRVVVKPDHERNAFLLMPVLRGICEDLAVLGAIFDADQSKRERVARALSTYDLRNAMDRQEAFFAKQRPFQPIMLGSGWQVTESTLLVEAQAAWRDIGYTLGGKSVRPPTKCLAMKVGIEYFYEYLYAITSDVVHFNPRVLLRTGWGKEEKKPTFSIHGFSRYYWIFSVFYGHYLLALFYGHFRKTIDASGQFAVIFDELRKDLDSWLRWPEIVTFEECNQKEPSQSLRILLR